MKYRQKNIECSNKTRFCYEHSIWYGYGVFYKEHGDDDWRQFSGWHINYANANKNYEEAKQNSGVKAVELV